MSKENEPKKQYCALCENEAFSSVGRYDSSGERVPILLCGGCIDAYQIGAETARIDAERNHDLFVELLQSCRDFVAWDAKYDETGGFDHERYGDHIADLKTLVEEIGAMPGDIKEAEDDDETATI